jgi:hypothetical protein
MSGVDGLTIRLVRLDDLPVISAIFMQLML